MASGTRACSIVLRDSMEGRLGIIADSLRENYIMISVAVVAVSVAIALVWLIAGNIWTMVQTYRLYTRRHEPSVSVSSTKDVPDDQINASIDAVLTGRQGRSPDDYGPHPRSSADQQGDPVSERDSVAKKMEAVQRKYADYNKEITQYSRDVLKREPEDVMDRRILGGDDDVYQS